ncbi:MAG TPA: 3-dehydroquinate synthase family protein [Acidimicrobiales bacterium]|nr:3-dehydroquinate synthase family protein [Acidimicrobiales bacterium]
MIRISVDLPQRTYDVLVGRGAVTALAGLLPGGVRKVAIVTQPGIEVPLDPGVATTRVEIASGEQAKSIRSVEELCRDFARAGLSRHDAVVAVGGGVVSDVAGFASACYLRGIAYVNVATTLLAQVDAAVGGKTGVNLPEGKNLVGAFWQPAGVICDIETLASLPDREWASGRGEMAKCAFLERFPGEGRPGAALAEKDLAEQVAYCVSLKAAVVEEDEREGGRRMLLNYGHTLAHALEAVSLAGGPVDLRHGEAVAVGLMFAAQLARRMGRIDDERVGEHRAVLDAFGLRGDLPGGLQVDELVQYMARDKKARHDLTFVLDGPKGVEPVRGVALSDVVAVLEDMGCSR